jgi:hypothetical protein
MAVHTAFGQCQASFISYYSPIGDTLVLVDNSYSTDSVPLTGVTYDFTVQIGGTSYTSTSNPAVFYLNGYTGNVYACLTINTLSGCSSVFCDSVALVSGPVGCTASFGFVPAVGPPNTWDFYSTSTASPSDSIIAYDWTFWSATPGASDQPNATVTFPVDNQYQYCLTIYTASGCSDQQCGTSYFADTMPDPCLLTIIPSITNVSTGGSNDGAIYLIVNGGTFPYSYAWSNGATTQHIYSLSTGYYSVTITQANPSCPPTIDTFFVADPNMPLDTLYAPIVDTCLGYTPSNYFVNIVSVDTMTNTATLIWTLQDGGTSTTFTTTYPFTSTGPNVVVLTISCDSAKGLTSYMAYVNFEDYFGVHEYSTSNYFLYPNPFGDHFDITMPGGIREVMIYNNTGQIIWSRTGNVSESLSVDASSWPAGFYMVRLQGPNGKASAVVVKK